MEKNNIKIFNKNFFCENEKSINDVYLKKSDIYLFNNNVAFKTDKYYHPLFLNYNYCLFCYNRRKTKYFIKNLIDIHNCDISLSDYMKNNNIRLKKATNKKGKLIRRFVRSYDKDKRDETINFDTYINSDTELYIDFERKNNIQISKIKTNNVESSYYTANEFNDEIDKIKEKEFSSITLDENTNSKELNLEINLRIDEEIKLEKNLERMQKLKSHEINFKENIFKFNKAHENNNKNTKKKDMRRILNKSSDFLIVDDSQKTKEKKNYFSIFKSLAVDKLKKLKNQDNKKTKRRTSIMLGEKITNDHCTICLGEIKEKYTLICGDFFCRECIYERISSILKNIAEFDKIKCPLCNEPIEENTLKRLLNEKEFDFYEKIKMRIEGLKNKNLIPCPFPDCEGFANKEIEHKDSIFVCQNNHYFCQKCMEAVDPKLLFPKKRHICKNKYPETMKYFRIKKNRNIIKKCPNCDCWVQKEQTSCNNVICSNIWCNLEFCWICRKPYDEFHYKNPISMCFGLSSINSENYFTKNKRMRFLRCILIFLILIFIIFPFCLIFFSFIEIMIYLFVFLIEKSGIRNVKLKSEFTHKFFYRLMLLFYFMLSIALIPLGHSSLIILIGIMPFIFLIKKLKSNDDFD